MNREDIGRKPGWIAARPWHRGFGFAAAALIAGLVGALLGGVPVWASGPAYTDLGPWIASRPNGYHYAYAPVLIRENAGWRMLYCSSGKGVADWDWIRSATSADGRVWSAPSVLLKTTGGEGERAACDPSLVRYRAPGDAAPFYYLFYSGSPNGTGTAMFVARASAIEGPYAKWTGSDWEVDARSPQPIIRPAASHPDQSGFYGAGQQSVVVRDGRLHAWFTDDTACTPRYERIFTSQATDPTAWSPPVATSVASSSVDVKFDPGSRRFVMYAIMGPHSFTSYLVRWVSGDGVAWGKPDIVAGPTGFTHWAHNVGVSGDDQGHLVAGDLLVGFGAPSAADCEACWARWDLKGGLVQAR